MFWRYDGKALTSGQTYSSNETITCDRLDKKTQKSASHVLQGKQTFLKIKMYQVWKRSKMGFANETGSSLEDWKPTISMPWVCLMVCLCPITDCNNEAAFIDIYV